VESQTLRRLLLFVLFSGIIYANAREILALVAYARGSGIRLR